jgi:hypothetical protein
LFAKVQTRGQGKGENTAVNGFTPQDGLGGEYYGFLIQLNPDLSLRWAKW